MLVTIHQPNPYPRLKVLAKLAAADAVICLDTVQFVRREWQSRFVLRQRAPSNTPFFFTFAVATAGKFDATIKEVEVSELSRDVSRLEKTVRNLYSGLAGSDSALAALAPLSIGGSKIGTLAAATTNHFLTTFGLPPMRPVPEGCTERRNALLVSICKEVGATDYLSGSGGMSYLDPSLFKASGITARVHRWRPPEDGTDWRNVSCLDFAGRKGLDDLMHYLKGGAGDISVVA